MPLPTHANLEYRIVPTNLNHTLVITAMGAVVLYTNPLTDPVLKGLLDCTVNTDTTTLGAGFVHRQIQLNLGAGFFRLFPTPIDWTPVFNGFYRSTLRLALAADVQEVPTVFV